MKYTLGVDLGTTYTAAAISDSNGSKIVGLAHDRYAIPSVVAPPFDGSPILIGSEALTIASTAPERVAREFKRRFGDAAPIVVGGEAWLPEDLSGMLFGEVVKRVTDEVGSTPNEVVITHPATWKEHRLDLLHSMAVGAGVMNASFISEPEAAAIHYHDRRVQSGDGLDRGARIAVYDLGGGTFDAAVLGLEGDSYEILGQPEGIDWLGGLDFDEAVFNIVREDAGELINAIDHTSQSSVLAIARLRQECTLAKEVLSQENAAIVPVVLPNDVQQVRVERSRFIRHIEHLVEETIDALYTALDSAGCSNTGDIESVLLVGGSSRVPLVSERLTERLGVPVLIDSHPKQAIALGAALSTTPLPSSAPKHNTGSWVGDTRTTEVTKTTVEPVVLPPMTVAVSGIQEAVAHRYFVVLNGLVAGRAIQLAEGETILGRTPTDEVVGINDDQVSRQHLKVAKDGDLVTITDLNSTNGTWLDGQRLSDPAVLLPGDIVEIGSTLLLLEAPLVSSPAPDMLADSWALPPIPIEAGLLQKFRRRSLPEEWLADLEAERDDLTGLAQDVRRARRLFRRGGPRTYAWQEHSPERIYKLKPDDPHYGWVTVGYGPSHSLVDLDLPRSLRAEDGNMVREFFDAFKVDEWTPIGVSLISNTCEIALPGSEAKALLRSVLFEFVSYHAEVPVRVYGIDPTALEWEFLAAGNVEVGRENSVDIEFDALVVSFEPGRVTSVGSPGRFDERGQRGTVRIRTTSDPASDADYRISASPDDPAVRMLHGPDGSATFVPVTLPRSRESQVG